MFYHMDPMIADWPYGRRCEYLPLTAEKNNEDGSDDYSQVWIQSCYGYTFSVGNTEMKAKNSTLKLEILEKKRQGIPNVQP